MKLHSDSCFFFEMSGQQLQRTDRRIVHCKKTYFFLKSCPVRTVLFFHLRWKIQLSAFFRKINLPDRLLIQSRILNIFQKYLCGLLSQTCTVSGKLEHAVILADIDPGFFGTADQDHILRCTKTTVFHCCLDSICDLTTCRKQYLRRIF